MTNKIYTLEEFKEGKIAIHVKTQKEYNKLMKRLERAGLRWVKTRGKQEKPTEYDAYFNHTKKGICIKYEEGICWSRVEFCEEAETTIIIRPIKLT